MKYEFEKLNKFFSDNQIEIRQFCNEPVFENGIDWTFLKKLRDMIAKTGEKSPTILLTIFLFGT